MKKLLIILITFIILGCKMEPDIPKYTADSEEVNPLIGTWVKDGKAWDFYDNGDFLYYNIDPLEVYNDGWYGIESGVIYLEDYYNGQSATYDYEVIEDFPDIGDTTLRWLPGDWLKQ